MRQMKDSGIEWIGEIPEGWEVRKVKKIFSIVNGSTPKSDYSDFWDGDIIWVTPAEMSDDIYIIDNSKRKLTTLGYTSCGTTLVPKNSILISSRAPIGQVALAGNKLCTNQGCKALVSNDEISEKFFCYFFKIQSSELNSLGKGTTFLELSSSELGNFIVPYPPLEEQQRIADYLDAKCAHIDQCLELTRQSMEKLRAYKLSCITEAVTKGLDPDVPLKDSGVPWIGQIPVGWTLSSVRGEFENLDGRRKPISAENRTCSDAAYDYYGASGIIDKIDDFIFDETLILIGEDGANLALRNLPLVYIAKGKYWVNNHAHILKPYNTNNLYYMAYQLECVDLTNYITGSTQPKLTQSNLSKIPVVCPPLPEQERIAAYLDKKCARIDALLEEKQALLDKLAEYKKA